MILKLGKKLKFLNGSEAQDVIPNRLQEFLKCANTKGWQENGSNGTFHISLGGVNTDKITVEDNFIVSITI